MSNISLFIVLLFLLGAMYISLSTNLFKFCSNEDNYYSSIPKNVFSEYEGEYKKLCETVFVTQSNDSVTAAILRKFYKLVIDLEKREIGETRYKEWLKEPNFLSFKIKMIILKYASICIYIGLLYSVIVVIPMLILDIIGNWIKCLGYFILSILVIDVVVYFFELNTHLDSIKNYLMDIFYFLSSFQDYIKKTLL